MIRRHTIAVATALLVVGAVSAQTTTSTDDVRAVGGTPGSWVQGALSRHSGLIGDRVTGPRNGETPTLATDSSSSSSSSSGVDLSSLLSLLGSGGLGDITSLLDGLTGTTTDTTGSSDATDTTGDSSSTSLADMIAAMAEAQGAVDTRGKSAATAQNLDLTDLTSLLGSLTSTPATNTDATTTDTSTTTLSATEVRKNFGGAVARLTKPETRVQSAADERGFGTRFLDSTLSTVFTAVAAGMQSTDFINFLKDQLRPLILPTESSSTNNNTDNTNSDTSGGGIEDLNPSDGNTDNGGGSTI